MPSGRLVAAKLSERLGKQFVAEDQRRQPAAPWPRKRSAGSAPDGHTLLFELYGRRVSTPCSLQAPYDPHRILRPDRQDRRHSPPPSSSIRRFQADDGQGAHRAWPRSSPASCVAAAAGGGKLHPHLSTELFTEGRVARTSISRSSRFKGGGTRGGRSAGGPFPVLPRQHPAVSAPYPVG